MTKRKIQYWVIPPESDSEFVASMEDVLDTYALPYNKSIPVVCMDEQPVQLLNEKRASIFATREHAKRVDYGVMPESCVWRVKVGGVSWLVKNKTKGDTP